MEHQRFWTRTLSLPVLTPPGSDAASVTAAADLQRVAQFIADSGDAKSKGATDFAPPELGIVLIPRHGLLVPIHEGRLQTQHALVMPQDRDRDQSTASTPTSPAPASSSDAPDPLSITLCGFAARAQQVSVAPSDEERPVDPERLRALDAALANMTDISGALLTSAQFAGTSPARIYRSFVAPRPQARYILEPVERAAKRTAAQIELSLRQVRADQASYLRNLDRPAALLRTPGEGEEAGAGEGDGGVRLARPTVHPVALVLDNVRSAFNVGSMFRSAETAGAAEVVTCGITAHPPHPKLRKTALSAVEVVPSRHFDDVVQAIATLRAEGYHIVVMETTSRSVLYTDAHYPAKTALVLGNEITGVDARVIELADHVVEIPCFGVKNSLNVASAAPVVLFEVLRQWSQAAKVGSGADTSGAARESS